MVENLPVKSVVLYKNGVGYVERGGLIEGKTAILEFRREDMDDVLKSLFVVDKGGGAVVGVSYDGAEDVQEKLQKKALVPPEKEALIGLLRKLPGYRLRAKTTSSQVEGEVVGTDETEMIAAGDVAIGNPKLILRDASGMLVPVPIRELLDVEILDEQASEDLQYFLRLITAERKSDRRGLTVYMEGARHDLRISYLTSAPSWRVTYRLDHHSDETFIQAWGVVDNWLEEDLKDVRISLVAGKPISFIYDVYVPRSVQRPVIREEVRTLDTPVELEASPEGKPEADEEAFGGAVPASAPAASRAAPKAKFAPMMLQRRALASQEQRMAPGEPPSPSMAESARVETRQIEGGEFFRYDVVNPLTVLRGQSAMLPIVQARVKARRELVYNGAKVPGNPVAVLYWLNDGGVLERGPTVVLEDGTYAGEGILPYTTRDGVVKVAFAVDLGVQITEEVKSESRTIGLHIDRTYARREQKQRMTRTYSIDNRKMEVIDLVVEHPRIPGWNLVESPKPDEETPDLRRFRSSVKPKSHATLTIVEERVDWISQETQTFGAGLLEGVLETLTGPTLAQVKALLTVYKEKARLERSLETLQQTRNTLNNEQARVRTNLITTVQANQKEMQQKYTTQLQALEQRLVGLLEEEDKLKASVADLEKRADQLIDTWPSQKDSGPGTPSPPA
jgi:hypothetical protein